MKKKLVASVLTVLCLTSLNTMAANHTTDKNVDNRSAMPMHRPVANRSELAPHIGLMAGVAAPEGRYGTNGEYGIDIGYQPYIPFGAGLEVSHVELRNSTDNDKLERTNVLLKASYNFGGTTPVIRDSYIGLGLGAVLKQDGTDLATAPFFGFDIPLAARAEDANFSLGANAKYLIVSGSDPDAFSVNGVLKYWY